MNSEAYRKQANHFIDRSEMLSRFDCCPGSTSQVGAMVIGSKGDVEVKGWKNVIDQRSIEDRSLFEGYPKNEAAYKAFFGLIKASGVSSDELLHSGLFEIHDAFGPLVPMTFMEMGMMGKEDLVHGWRDAAGLPVDRTNAMGGLKSGHALGATALVRMHESRMQLLGEAPNGLQVKTPLDYALIQSVMGPRDQISMTLFQRI